MIAAWCVLVGLAGIAEGLNNKDHLLFLIGVIILIVTVGVLLFV